MTSTCHLFDKKEIELRGDSIYVSYYRLCDFIKTHRSKQANENNHLQILKKRIALMRNQFLLLIGIMMITFSSFGQFKLGVNANYSSTIGEAQSLSLLDNRGFEIYNLSYLGQENFYSIGLTGYAEKGNLYFMPAVNYRSTTHSIQVMDYGEGGAEVNKSKIETQSIHIPITAGVKYKKFRLGVGPDFNMVLDTNEDLSTYSGITFNERSLKTGFHFSLGYDPIPNVRLGINYELAFYNITNDYKISGRSIPLNATPKMLNFTVALFL